MLHTQADMKALREVIFHVGESVKVFSISQGKWCDDGEVIDVFDDGSVIVTYSSLDKLREKIVPIECICDEIQKIVKPVSGVR